jgi:hypothetical protein
MKKQEQKTARPVLTRLKALAYSPLAIGLGTTVVATAIVLLGGGDDPKKPSWAAD